MLQHTTSCTLDTRGASHQWLAAVWSGPCTSIDLHVDLRVQLRSPSFSSPTHTCVSASMTAWHDAFAAAVFVVAMSGLVSELARTGGAADSRAAVRTVRLRAMECTFEVRSPEWNSMECVACAFACDGMPPIACNRSNRTLSLSRQEECSHDITFTRML